MKVGLKFGERGRASEFIQKYSSDYLAKHGCLITPDSKDKKGEFDVFLVSEEIILGTITLENFAGYSGNPMLTYLGNNEWDAREN